MILSALMVGILASFLVWLVTSVRLFFRGRLLLPISAAGVHSLCGAALVLVSMKAPRFSAFWTGAAGGGDGQALIGLFMAGCFVFVSGIVLMLISCALAALSGHLTKRRQDMAR